MARQQKKDDFVADDFTPDDFVADDFVPDAPTPVEPIRSSAPPTGDIANRPDATIFHFPEKHPLFQRRRDQISNFVGQSNWIPDALRGPAGTAATYLGVDAPLDIINSFGDPAGMLGAGMGLLNRAGAAGQGVRNIGQKLLTDGGYATPNVVSTELREIGSRMLPPGPRGVGPQNLLPETTARTFVAPPAGVGGQPAQTLFPSHMVDPALAGEVVTSGRPQSPFAGSLTSKLTPDPGTIDPRFVDLEELR